MNAAPSTGISRRLPGAARLEPARLAPSCSGSEVDRRDRVREPPGVTQPDECLTMAEERPTDALQPLERHRVAGGAPAGRSGAGETVGGTLHRDNGRPWVRRVGRKDQAMDVPPRYPAGRLLRASAAHVTFEVPVPGLLRARVRGELRPDAARELHWRVEDELLHRHPRRLVIELSGVRFLGLHGIAVLDRLRRGTGCRRLEVTLGDVSPTAERALRLAGVLDRFERAGPAWTHRAL